MAVLTGKIYEHFLFTGIYFEKRWEQNIRDFHKEMNISRLVMK